MDVNLQVKSLNALLHHERRVLVDDLASLSLYDRRCLCIIAGVTWQHRSSIEAVRRNVFSFETLSQSLYFTIYSQGIG